MENAVDFVKKERFQGWSTRLLGCLAMQLCRAEIHCQRSAMILHLVSHLSLSPDSGKNIHSALISRSLTEFLCSCDLNEVIGTPCSDEVFQELMHLDCLSCSIPQVDSVEDGCGDNVPLHKEKMVFSYEGVLHAKCDGFSEPVCDHCQNVTLFDNFDLCDETLETLCTLCPCIVSSDFSSLRTTAFAISIVSRLTSELNDGFKNVVQNFMQITVPDIQNLQDYRNWFTLMVLTTRATRCLVTGFVALEERVEALCLYIRLTLQFAHSMAHSLISGIVALDFSSDSVTSQKEEEFVPLILKELLRLIEDVIRIIDTCFAKAILRMPPSERPKEDCARLLSNRIITCCEDMGYTEIVRNVFTIVQSFGVSQSLFYQNYYDSISRLAIHFQILQDWYSKAKSGMVIREVCVILKVFDNFMHRFLQEEKRMFNCVLRYGNKCPAVYLFYLCTDLMSGFFDRELFLAIVTSVQDLPPGVCSCVHAADIFEKLLVENAICSVSDEFYSAFAFHLKSFLPLGDINFTMYECHEIFIKNFSSKYPLLQYTLNLLTLCIPYCSVQSREEILLEVLKRCDANIGFVENPTIKWDDVTSRQLLFIEFLCDVPLDEKMSELCFRELISPVVRTHNVYLDYFNTCVELASNILASNGFCSYKEEIILCLCEFVEGRLPTAQENFKDFLNLPVVHMIIAILEAFMDSANILKEISMDMKVRLSSLCSSYLDLFFNSSLSDDISATVLYSLGQFIGLCLGVRSLFDNNSEAVEDFYKKAQTLIFEKPLCLWKSVLCCVVKISFRTRYSDGDIFRKFGNLKICSVGFRLMNDIISKWNMEKLEEHEDLFITSICKAFITATNTLKKGEYLVDYDISRNLYKMLSNLSNSVCSKETFKTVIRVYSKFISVQSKSCELKPLFSLYCRTARFKAEILEVIQNLLEETSDNPACCLVFPQESLPEVSPCAADLTRDESREENNEGLLEEAPRQNSLRSVFERLLSFTSFERAEASKVRDSSTVNPTENGQDELITGYDVEELRCGAEVRLGDLPVDLSAGIFVSFWFSPTNGGNCSVSFMEERVPEVENYVFQNRTPYFLPICCFNRVNFSVHLAVVLATSTFYVIAYSNKKKVHETCQRHRTILNSWTHITFSLSQKDGECIFQVSLRNRKYSFMNGSIMSEETGGLVFQFGALYDNSEPKVLGYEISSIFGFRGAVDEQASLALYSLGCDLCSLVETKTTCLQYLVHLPFNFSRPELVQSHEFDRFFCNLPNILRSLQQNHIFVVRSSAPQTLDLYILQSDCSQALRNQQLLSSSPIPKNYSIYWKCDFVQKHNKTIHRCLYPLGSTRLLIYFLAHAVDTSSDCEVQATALRLLLTYIKRGSLVRKEFCFSRGCDIVSRCYSSPLATIGPATIKVITEHSIVDFRRDVYCYVSPSGVIYDPELLTSFCCCTDIWRGSDRIGCWVELLKVISGCVSNDFSLFAQFNRKQLCRTRFLMHLLLACQRMVQEKKSFPLISSEAGKVVGYITKITANLIESAESVEYILLLWDFIFLSHPAVDTYLNSKISGHADWIRIEYMKDEREESLEGESELAGRLRDYARRLGKEKIAELWAKKRSIVALRKLYEEANSSNGGNDSYCNEGCSAVKLVKNDDNGKSDKESEATAGNDRKPCENEMQESSSSIWFEDIRTGITKILSDITQNGTDSMIIGLFQIISWQSISVLLTNQENEAFRDAVFLFLQNFMLRAPLNERQLFVKGCGFAILGNQLRGYPVTSQIADSLFSLCCGEPVRLEDGLDADHVKKIVVDQFNCSSFDALFVLWEESASLETAVVFWNISSGLLKIFEQNSLLMQAMMDAQLCDVLVGILRRIAAISIEETDVENVYACSPLFECWSSVSRLVISSCVPFSDTRHCDMCQRMVLLLECALLEFSKIGNRFAEKKMRKGLCLVLTWWMNTLQNAFSDSGTSISAVPSVESLASQKCAGLGSRESPDSSSSVSSVSSRRSVSPMTALVSGSLASLREKIASIGDQLKCRYKWRTQLKIPCSVEIVNRVLFGMSAISHIFTMIPPSDDSVITEEEEKLFYYFVCFLFSTWKTDRSASTTSSVWNARISGWTQILLSCRDRARLILSQLLAYFVFPAERKLGSRSSSSANDELSSFPPLLTFSCRLDSDLILKRRLLIIHMFANDILYNPMLKALLDINLDYQYTMNLALHELAVIEKGVDELSIYDIEKLVKFLRKLQIESPFANLSEDRLQSLTSDEKLSIHSYLENRSNYLLAMRQKASAIVDDEQIYIEQLKQLAMSETCAVVDNQNLLRKKYIKDCREIEMRMLRADELLSELAVQLCHPEAVCHDPSSWPLSWELDPTEGPNRERRRLTPVHLRFDRRFLLPEYEAKLRNRERLLPLSNLLSGRRTSNKEWNMTESLAPEERIRTVKQATVVRSTVESQGEVLIGDKKFYFFGSGTRTTQKGIMQTTEIVMAWDYEQVVEVYKRHNLLKDRALEIFFSDGQTYLIAFENSKERDQFLDSLLSMYLPNLNSTPQNLQTTAQLWREGSITNFEYLMQLNKLAGRTFNDLMQYPVFPFVIADYISDAINLADISVYRDLSKPMAIQNKEMEQHYLHNYVCLEQERKRALLTHSTPATLGPYHYGSHYSNSGIVVHYLVRLPPFTEIALEYQDNSFDIPDRLFNSIATTWRLSSSESTTDFKELIPEFFYCHEFLVNYEGLNLGVRQNGDTVNDVILPNWCMGNPRLFILVHRQALESSVVTASLHSWIDLIFGYKQTGTAAIQAINVFHPATYRGGLSALENSEIDPISVDALETMVRTYGQMPTQLFLSPHLPHMITKTSQLSLGKHSKSPIKSVMRIRWGEFVGSPDSEYGEPIVDLKQLPSLKFGHLSHLYSFLDSTCFAYPDKTLLLLRAKMLGHSKEMPVIGLLSWRFSDSIVRVCLLGSTTPTWKNAIDLYNFKVTTAAFLATSGLLFIALRCGVIRVYRIYFENEVSWNCIFLRELFAHEGDVTTISLCGEYAVAITGCTNGKVCVWDTNKLSYVRTIFSHPEFSVLLSCVSPTTCEIGILLQSLRKGFRNEEEKLNIVKLYTINGDLVGEAEIETSVTAMTMTNLPEGTAVNCLVLGLQNGIVRFLNMWTMEHLRDISNPNYLEPVVSMVFCCRCTRLYTCLASGSVICWHGDGLNAKRSASLVVVSSSGSYEKPFSDELE